MINMIFTGIAWKSIQTRYHQKVRALVLSIYRSVAAYKWKISHKLWIKAVSNKWYYECGCVLIRFCSFYVFICFCFVFYMAALPCTLFYIYIYQTGLSASQRDYAHLCLCLRLNISMTQITTDRKQISWIALSIARCTNIHSMPWMSSAI